MHRVPSQERRRYPVYEHREPLYHQTSEPVHQDEYRVTSVERRTWDEYHHPAYYRPHSPGSQPGSPGRLAYDDVRGRPMYGGPAYPLENEVRSASRERTMYEELMNRQRYGENCGSPMRPSRASRASRPAEEGRFFHPDDERMMRGDNLRENEVSSTQQRYYEGMRTHPHGQAGHGEFGVYPGSGKFPTAFRSPDGFENDEGYIGGSPQYHDPRSPDEKTKKERKEKDEAGVMAAWAQMFEDTANSVSEVMGALKRDLFDEGNRKEQSYEQQGVRTTPKSKDLKTVKSSGSQEDIARRATDESQSVDGENSLTVVSADAAALAGDESPLRKRYPAPEADKRPVFRGSGQEMSYLGYVSAKNGKLNDLLWTLDCGLHPDTVDSEKKSLLTWAARMGHVDVVCLLIERGATVDFLGTINAHTPLFWAAKNGQTKCVQKLLLSGADVNMLDERCHSALMYAAAGGHLATCAVLVKHGADVNHEARLDSSHFKSIQMANIDRHFNFEAGTRANLDWEELSEGKTALQIAARLNRKDIVLFLVQSKANLNQQDDRGRSAVFWAALSGHVNTLAALVHFRATDINLPDKDGNSPLMWAVRQNHFEVVKFLCQMGADTRYSPADEKARTARNWAMQYSGKEMVNLLEEYGA